MPARHIKTDARPVLAAFAVGLVLAIAVIGLTLQGSGGLGWLP